MGSNNNSKYTNIIKITSGMVLGGVGVAAAFETDTGLESLSTLVLGLSCFFGLVAGVADDIEPLRRAFKKGYWLIVSVAILSLFVLVGDGNESVAPIVIGFALAFSIGVIVSTIGIIIVEKDMTKLR